VHVRLTPRARRQLDRLPGKQADLVRDELEKLAAEDENLDVRKMAGEADSYRLRIGDYRVIFNREAGQVAVVTRIGHRRDVYRRN
jgi:mRNA interferase RelE/StbE